MSTSIRNTSVVKSIFYCDEGPFEELTCMYRYRYREIQYRSKYRIKEQEDQ